MQTILIPLIFHFNIPQVPQNVERSELLPAGWNASQDIYALLYQPSDSDDTHLLKCIPVDGSMLVHVLVSDKQVD